MDSAFGPPRKVDHGITGHWSADEARWVRVDVEHLDFHVVESPHDLPLPSPPA